MNGYKISYFKNDQTFAVYLTAYSFEEARNKFHDTVGQYQIAVILKDGDFRRRI